MNKIIASGILIFSTLSIIPMNQSIRKLSPSMIKSLAGLSGNQRNITGYLPEIAEAALVFTSLNLIHAGIIHTSYTNDDKARINKVQDKFNNQLKYTESLDFNKKTNELTMIKKEKITAESLATIAIVSSIACIGVSSIIGGADILLNCFAPSTPSHLFFTGHFGISLLSILGLKKQADENKNLKEILFKKIEKEKENEQLKKIVMEALLEKDAHDLKNSLAQKTLHNLNHIKLADLKK